MSAAAATAGRRVSSGLADLVLLMSDICNKTISCRFQDDSFYLTNLKDIGETHLVMTVTTLDSINNMKFSCK